MGFFIFGFVICPLLMVFCVFKIINNLGRDIGRGIDNHIRRVVREERRD